MDPSSHDSFCGYLLKDALVWHPEESEICYAMWSAMSDDALSVEEMDKAKEALRSWVSGCSRNLGDNPYLLEEESWVILFPGAPVTSVVPRHEAQPVLDSIRNAVVWLGEGLNVLDINLEAGQLQSIYFFLALI